MNSPTETGRLSDAATPAEHSEEILIAAYQASVEQNKLYAEFRWKVFSYISTLQAGLFVLILSTESAEMRLTSCLVGIFVAFLLWMLERRHHQLFTQSRNAGKRIESMMALGGVGVFSHQLDEKRGLGHAKLIQIITTLTIIMWISGAAYNAQPVWENVTNARGAVSEITWPP